MLNKSFGQPSPAKPGKEADHIIAELNDEYSLGLTFHPNGSSFPQTTNHRAISTLLQFLYRNDRNRGAKVVNDFKRQAREIRSCWIFKPKADADLLPRRESRVSQEANAVNGLSANQIDSLRSLLLSQLQNAKDQYFLSCNQQRLPLRSLSQDDTTQPPMPKKDERQKPSEMRKAPYSSILDSQHLPGSSLDDDLLNFDIERLELPDAHELVAVRTQTDDDTDMTDTEIYQTPPESPAQDFVAPGPNTSNMYLQAASMRKRESPESINHVGSRKRSMHYADMPSPAFDLQREKFLDAREASESFTTSSQTDNSTVKTSANNSFMTEATSTSFFQPKQPDRSWEAGAQSTGIISMAQNGNDTSGPPITSNGSPTKTGLPKRLEDSPLAQDLDRTPANVPLRVVYEVTRIALHCKISTEALFEHLKSLDRSRFDDYDYLWSHLVNFAMPGSGMPLVKSHAAAWKAAEGSFDRVSFKATLSFSKDARGPLFTLQMDPLALEDSYRLARHFGFDRFLVLTIPPLEARSLARCIQYNAEEARVAIIEWLVDSAHFLLGRQWRAFYAKPKAKHTKVAKEKDPESPWRVYLFAVDGHGFHAPGFSPGVHQRKSLQDMIKWFLPFRNNLEAPALKLFSRLQLAVSRTTPTIIFHPHQIVRCDDAGSEMPGRRYLNVQRHHEKLAGLQRSYGKVMSDGCSRISQRAAKEIVAKLGLVDHLPSAFQARIGGAKGMWVVDPLGETLNDDPIWIEIADSQLKFEGHSNDSVYADPHRMTFEVHAYSSSLKPAVLNFQLMPILIDRGVDKGIFVTRLREDLNEKATHLVASMQDPLSLRSWNQENNPVTSFRIQEGSIRWEGALPGSIAEQINSLTESGFDPKSCKFLKNLCQRAIKAYCERLEERMHIQIGQSTYALMIPDFMGVLEEDEIHLGFSSNFTDSKSGFSDTMVDGCDVLIARNPAALPSDVHRVKAVFHRELAKLKDVIVFPTKGEFSLAEKLSGGDFDGDRAWICWDQEIVQGFSNYDMPAPRPPEYYGIIKDTVKIREMFDEEDFVAKFLRKGLLFSMRSSLMGICTSYHGAYCYDLSKKLKAEPMADARAIEIGQLLGHLVDTGKNGYTFTGQQWDSYKLRRGLPRMQPKVAYKDKERETPPSLHVIDQLVLVVAKRIRQDTLSEFEKPLKNIPDRDPDLLTVLKAEEKAAKEDPDIKMVLSCLKQRFEKLYDSWVVGNDDRMNFAAVADRLRCDFNKIHPWPETSQTRPKSTLVGRWIEEFNRPCDAYATQNSWALVKASALYANYANRGKGSFPWYTCGEELMAIKVIVNGRRPSLTAQMHHSMKLDRKMLERIARRQTENALGRPNLEADAEIAELDADEFIYQDYEDAFETLSWAEYDIPFTPAA